LNPPNPPSGYATVDADPSSTLWGPRKWRDPKGQSLTPEGSRGVTFLGRGCFPPHQLWFGAKPQRPGDIERKSWCGFCWYYICFSEIFVGVPVI